MEELNVDEIAERVANETIDEDVLQEDEEERVVPQHVIDEALADDARQRTRDLRQMEMYDDEMWNWSGLRQRIMEEYLGPVKTKRELFLKLTKKISKPDYTMHFMEDRNGRRAMFYNYKGVEIKQGECVLLKATIAEHRYDRYNKTPLTYINRVTILRNMGTVEKPKIVFGEQSLERGTSRKTWQEQLADEDLEDALKV